MNLNEILHKHALDCGADIFGVADLDRIREPIKELYNDDFSSYSRAISIGVYLPNSVVNRVLDAPDHSYLAYYEIANSLINHIVLRLNNYLEKNGYKTLPVPASQRSGSIRDFGTFSHRLAASEAGLGWIGKNCSLITKEVGPRLRLGTILTDAPLLYNEPMANQCGNCMECVNICPSGAILGESFVYGQDRDMRFAFHKCDNYLTEVRQVFGKRVCGKCVAVCPWGRRKDNGK